MPLNYHNLLCIWYLMRIFVYSNCSYIVINCYIMEDVMIVSSVRWLIGVAETYDYKFRLCFYPSIFGPFWRLHIYEPRCKSPYPDTIWSKKLDAGQAARLQAMGIR